MAKKLLIQTYGCQMNVYDSARMTDVLAPLGFGPAERPADADMVILNTCHIRAKAAEKVYSELGRLRRLKAARRAAGGDMIIAVAGCVAQAEGVEMRRRAPHVDIVLGPQAYHRLPEMVARAARTGGGVIDTDFPVEPKFDHLPDNPGGAGPSAFLTVQEGCDKFCTFCVVPYTRGAEYSRPAAAIVDEARRLIAAGACEVTLLGQNVNAYHGPGPDGTPWSLARLIRRMADLDGLERLRYTTSHPLEMDDDLVALHGEIEKVMPYIHLPVQSGSDRVLEAMNRRHRAADYLRIVGALRAARPDIAVSGDFIVGFPGESDADFSATLDLVRRVEYAQAYSFKYSPRAGTPAAGSADTVPEPVKEARLAELQSLLDGQRRAFNESWVGRRTTVLFERRGRHRGQLVGRSPHMQAVHATAPDDRLARLAEVRIDAAEANSLAGALVGRAVA